MVNHYSEETRGLDLSADPVARMNSTEGRLPAGQGSTKKFSFKVSIASHPRLRVDLDALAHNHAVLTSAAAGAEVACVVKANAYGLGVGPVARRLWEQGCRTFFINNAREGVELRELLRDAEIFVLAPMVDADIDVLLKHELRPCLYDWDDIQRFVVEAIANGARPRAALHVETGIHRLGLDASALRAYRDSDASDALEVSLLMSHLACADEPESPLNQRQLDRFQAIRSDFPDVRASLANSAGIFLGPDYHFDMVRPGIALYGHDPHYRETPARVVPVATLEASLAQVSTVAGGESVGYGALASSDVSECVGTILCGYADGIPRLASERRDGSAAVVYVAGRRGPIYGRMSMDLTTVNLSGFAGAMPARGAAVEFFGNHVRIEEVAEHVGTIPYELLTGLGQRVERVYFPT